MADEAHRDIPAPEPDPEPNPEPDSAISLRRSSMTPADWDSLFDAVTQRLQAGAQLASLESLVSLAEHPLGIAASLEETVQECVVSLKRLHAAMPH